MAILSGRQAVDSAVDSGPFLSTFGDLLSTFDRGRQVDINLSKLLEYIYIPDNKGKVDRRSTRVDSGGRVCLLPRKFARYVYLSTHADFGMFRGGAI